jgi:hypothetical protein
MQELAARSAGASLSGDVLTVLAEILRRAACTTRAALLLSIKALGACCYGRYFRELDQVDENALRRVQMSALLVVGDRASSELGRRRVG